MPPYRLPSSRGPLARLFTMLVLLAAFVVSLFLGAVLFLVVLGALLLLALALYLRFWWLRRRWARQAGQGSSHSDKPGPVTLEGEYTEHRDPDARRDD